MRHELMSSDGVAQIERLQIDYANHHKQSLYEKTDVVL